MDELSRGRAAFILDARRSDVAYRTHSPDPRAFPASWLSHRGRRNLRRTCHQTVGAAHGVRTAAPIIARPQTGLASPPHGPPPNFHGTVAGRLSRGSGSVEGAVGWGLPG